MIEEFGYYTGKKPKSFILNSKEYESSAWSDMAIKLFDLLYEYNPIIFERLAERKFKNPKTPLIAKEDYDIPNRSKKLTNAKIYVEMHHSTTSFLRFMMLVLKEYKLENNFEIIIGE